MHLKSRLYWYKYVVGSAKARGLIPVPWDAGGKGDGTMSVIDRATNGVFDQDLLTALRTGAGLPAVRVATTSLAARIPEATGLQATVSNGSIHVAYPAEESGKVQVTVTNLLGETLWSGSANAQTGTNTFNLPVTQRGLTVLRIQQGNHSQQVKVYCP